MYFTFLGVPFNLHFSNLLYLHVAGSVGVIMALSMTSEFKGVRFSHREIIRAWFLGSVYVTFSFLFHELGHCAAAKWLGIAVGEVTTMGARFATTYPGLVWSLSADTELVLSAGGPIFHILSAIPALIAAHRCRTKERRVQFLAVSYAIIGFAVWNLLPWPGSDGWHILNALLVIF